jgi:hypothetical protein
MFWRAVVAVLGAVLLTSCATSPGVGGKSAMVIQAQGSFAAGGNVITDTDG